VSAAERKDSTVLRRSELDIDSPGEEFEAEDFAAARFIASLRRRRKKRPRAR